MWLFCFVAPMVASASSLFFEETDEVVDPSRVLDAQGNSHLGRLNSSKKLLFSHVHKASGISFLRFLKALPGLTWCDDLHTDKDFG